jgi:hypothetical protein
MPAPVSPSTISGKYLVVTVGNILIAGAQDWDCDETGDQLDGTTGSDQGFENDDIGVGRAVITMNLVQNLNNGQYAVIQKGTMLANVSLYRSAGDPQPAFLFPFARVYQSKNAGKVKDRFTVMVVARSNGPYSSFDPGAG